MIKLLKKYIEESSLLCFSQLKDKSIISTLNYIQSIFVEDEYDFDDFIEKGALKTTEINKRVNFKWLFSKKERKKTKYFYSGEKFEEVLNARYGKRFIFYKRLPQILREPLILSIYSLINMHAIRQEILAYHKFLI